MAIMGYRTLSDREIELINEGKMLAEQVGQWIEKLRACPDALSPNALPTANRPLIDQRWVSVGRTQLQQGFMAVTRGIAQPTTF